MVQFKTLPVFLCLMGLLSETLCSLTLEAKAGDKVTIWCQHDLEHPDKIFWFKHTSDSVPLLLGCKRFLMSAPSVDCSFFNESERIVMSVHDKNTSLIITAVNVSDTGLYYCSYSDPMIFSNSTSLHVKDNEGVKSGGNKTLAGNSDRENGSDSPAVLFLLTVGFGAVSVILLSALIFIILKHRKTHTDAEAENVFNLRVQKVPEVDSVHYAALHFSNRRVKKNKRPADRMAPHVVYSSVGHSNVCA